MSLEISCESSAKQMIHMKFQGLFSKKKKNIHVYIQCIYLKVSSAAVVIGALRGSTTVCGHVADCCKVFHVLSSSLSSCCFFDWSFLAL